MDLPTDFRAAVRGLLRSAGFAIVGAGTLALGIAATATIFSVVYGVMLRPLPYRDADRLVVIQGEKAFSTGPRIMNFSAPEFEPFQSAATAFSSIALSGTTALTFRDANGVQAIPIATVSAEYFTTLGTAPILGRVVGGEAEPSIVISQRLWRRMFGGDTGVLGRSLTLSDSTNIERIYTIVGVMPNEFQLPSPRTDAWRTLAYTRTTGDQRVLETVVGGHEMVARIKDGVTLGAATADAVGVVERVLKPHFVNSRLDMHAKVSTIDAAVRGSMGPTLWVLMGAVTLVLLVACANVANLVLARQASRSREISMRLALGAPRARLLAYLLIESAIIAAAGAVIGVAIAVGAIRMLQWIQPSQLPRLDAIAVDWPTLACTTAAAAGAVVLAGLLPAILATRTDAILVLRSGSRGSTASAARRMRSALVVAEIAASIVLIVGASLLTRTLIALIGTDLGVNTQNVIAANLDMSPGPGRPVDDERRQQIAVDLEQRLLASPSVQSVGIGSGVPPSGEYMRVSFIVPNGTSTDSHMVTAVPASPGYFSTLQVRLAAGRLFDDTDSIASSPVVIINREAARRFYGGDNPIGRVLPFMEKQWTIVGVVENVKYTGIAAGPESVLYMPFSQASFRMSVLFARTTGDPAAVAGDMRRLITSYDNGIGVPRVWTLDDWISDATAQPRFRTILLSSIALITLLLSMVGLYGVIAYSTSQRTSEIGLRIAIGARQADVMRLVLREGVRLAIGGILLGTIGAFWAARLLASFLYQVTTTDLPAFAGAAIALLLVSMAATYIPARRAARIDPMTALQV